MTCYICGKTEGVIDDHHIDCAHGDKSEETTPLCRRCHRTYHDLGVEWFEDEYLDKVLEIENKRRAIYGLRSMRKEEIKRSDYWYKVHGIKREQHPPVNRQELIKPFVRPGISPLCGWDWLKRHAFDTYPEQWIEVKYDDRVIARVGASAKRGVLKRAIRERSKERT